MTTPTKEIDELIEFWRNHQAESMALRNAYPEIDPAFNASHCMQRDAHDLLVNRTIAALQTMRGDGMVSIGFQYEFNSPYGGKVWRDCHNYNGQECLRSREIFAAREK